MPWQLVDSFTIMWTDETAYQRQLGKIIESERPSSMPRLNRYVSEAF
jgi:hypothetical protein